MTPSLADSLIKALQEPGRERLLDLVRNPLCLTLLCHTWKNGSSLPDTQAELYDDYLKEVYEWNQNLRELEAQAYRCQTTVTELKKRLNRQLGELAKAALDMPQEHFRLSQALVEQYLGEEIDNKSLCYLALRLGWLNRVGVDARGKDIFAFYHATFQECFAALAVEDWDYFLPKQHRNFPVPGKEYRIFAPQWQQVVLLWLGRESGVTDEEKESFIEALLNFDDGQDSPNNLAELPELLQGRLKVSEASRDGAIGNLLENLQILYIDGSKFGDNPARKIYRQITQQGCPKSADGTPKNMADLQDYWEDLIAESDRTLALIFYENPKPPAPQGFSDIFLEALTRFDGAICAVGDVSLSGLQTFSPQDTQLIESIIAWLQEVI